MKKIIPTIVILLFSFALSAQYKKASFFGKDGRTYELGSQLYAMGDSKGSPIGLKIGFGKDKDGKRFFSSWELQFIPSYKYSFTTTDFQDEPVTVSGKAKNHFIYALNYGFHLLKNEGSERKVQPFITAGLNMVLSGGVKSETRTPDSYDLKRATIDQVFTGGIGGGLGCLINFTSKLGLKLQGGYNYQFHFDGSGNYPETETYHLFTSHPYVSVGLRLRVAAD
jgi:hypothetical protein